MFHQFLNFVLRRTGSLLLNIVSMYMYRLSQLNVSELLRGVGFILTTRNHIAMRGRKNFSNGVDGVVRKFRAFVQGHFSEGCQVSMMVYYRNAELTDMHLVYRSANCSGSVVKCLYGD